MENRGQMNLSNYLEKEINPEKCFLELKIKPKTIDGSDVSLVNETRLRSFRNLFCGNQFDGDLMNTIAYLIWDVLELPEEKKEKTFVFDSYQSSKLAMSRKMMRKFDIFAVDHVFFVVNCTVGDKHWALLVVKNPIGLFENTKEKTSVFWMDSLRMSSTSECQKYIKERMNLFKEWWNHSHFRHKEHGLVAKKYEGYVMPEKLRYEIYNEKFATIEPTSSESSLQTNQLPHQNNNIDCGLFVLLYFEKYWADRIDGDWSKMNENWFPPTEAFHGRHRWRCKIIKKRNDLINSDIKNTDELIGVETENLDFDILRKGTNGRNHEEKFDKMSEDELLKEYLYLPTYGEVRDKLLDGKKPSTSSANTELTTTAPLEARTRRSRTRRSLPSSVRGNLTRLPRNVEKMSEDEKLAWAVHSQLNANPNRSCKPSYGVDMLLHNIKSVTRTRVSPNKKRPLSRRKSSPRKKLPKKH